MKTKYFPKQFMWGAATSAHQVEGNNFNNDWHQAEVDGKVPHKSGSAANHYQYFEQDFEMAKSLNHNVHRFSLEWSRIEPEAGKFDEDAAYHYMQMIASLRKKGIEPIVTLHHFTNPQWFAKMGGWHSNHAAELFLRYADFCIKYFADNVKWWITINEPTVYFDMGYRQAKWPPNLKNVRLGKTAISNMLDAHIQSYKLIHSYQPQAKVSIAHNMTAIAPANPNSFFDRFGAGTADFISNRWVLEKIKDNYDFIGLNYYFYREFSAFPWPRLKEAQNAVSSDQKWSIEPYGLLLLLQNLKKYKKPILITENGLADAQDKWRWQFILSHLYAAGSAMEQDVEVIGYLHWSLLDNFEWADGFTPRFGLIEIDYKTQKRNIRPSAKLYAKLIEQSYIDEEMLDILAGSPLARKLKQN